MSDIPFSVTMDEKDVQRALQNMVKENAKLRAEIGMGVQEAKAAAAQEREWQKLREKATKDATSQMQQLNNAAQRIKDSVATPFEEAKKKVAELREHLQAGRITVDEYRKAYAAVGKEMKEASRDHAAEAEAAKAAAAAKAEASRLAAESEREHSQAVREATAIADKYATKEERVAAELKRLNTLKEKGVLSSKDYARAVEAEQKKLSETGEAADKSGGLIGGLTDKMGGFVSGLASGAAVVALLKTEYDELIERQGRSRDANIGLAAAQSGAIDNLDQTMTPQAFAERMRQVSKDLGMNERDLTVAASSALSAKGDKTAGEAIDAVVASAKLNRFAPDQLPAMSGSALDLGKHLNLKPEEALGFLLGTQRTARTVSLKGVTENIAPGIIGGVNMGMQKENAAAVAASLSGTSVDPTGAQTGTTMSALFMQLREFGKNKEAMGGQELDAQQVLKRLQADPALRAQFLAGKEQGGFGATFERKMQSAVEQLLTPGTQGFKDYQNALNTQRTLNPQQMFDQTVKAKESLAPIQIALQDQKLGNVANQLQLADVKGAESAVIRERMTEIRKAMGEGALKTKLSGVIDDVSTGGTQSVQSAMRNIEREIQIAENKLRGSESIAAEFGTSFDRTFRNDGGLYGKDSRGGSLTGDRETLKVLQEMHALLKAQHELQQRSEAENAARNHAGNVAGRAQEGRP